MKIDKAFPKIYNIIYPKNIIPQKSYSVKISIDNLGKKEPNVYIVRRSLRSKKELFDNLGNLRDHVFINDLKDVPRNSMSILCKSYKSEYVKFIVKGVGSKDWSGEEVLINSFINDVAIDKKPPIFFPLKSLHGNKFPFKKNLKKHPELKREIDKLTQLLKIEDNEFLIIEGMSYVCHSPTNSNYWHVEFCIKDMTTTKEVGRKDIKSFDEQKEIDNQHWATQAAYHALYDIIKPNAILKQPDDFNIIHEKYYIL